MFVIYLFSLNVYIFTNKLFRSQIIDIFLFNRKMGEDTKKKKGFRPPPKPKPKPKPAE